MSPVSTGELKLGGLKRVSVNAVHDVRLTVPISFDYHSFESLEVLSQECQWKDVKLSSIAVQLKSFPNPKVTVISFLGRIIKVEKTEDATLVTFDKFGEIKTTYIEV
ncbi:MAG: hypothetical protein K2X81_04430 [Candidatus Obscuribacterales bacterium]|nr:hypothetical protein [Candidatus Obscuribacterales bacterium]